MWSDALRRIPVWSLLGLLAFAVLWKGGKGLEATWLLTAVAGVMTLMWWQEQRTRIMNQELRIMNTGIPPGLWISAMLFVLWTILSYLFSTTGNYGLDEVLREGSLVLIFLWVARGGLDSCSLSPPLDHELVARDPEASSDPEREVEWRGEPACRQAGVRERGFVHVLVWSTLLACLIGLMVYIFQPVNRFVGTFFDFRFHTDYWPNAWAEYLLLAWPLLLVQNGKWKMENGKWQGKKFHIPHSTFYIPILGFVLGCLLLSYSRGAMLAFGGQVVVLGILQFLLPLSLSLHQGYGRQAGERGFVSPLPKGGGQGEGYMKNILFRALLAVSIALLTFSTANALRSQFYPVQDIGSKVTFTADEGRSSVDERRSFWLQAWELSKERPLLGWGPYSFRFIQPRLQEDVLVTSDHPHSVFLKLAMERGWPAAILFAVIVGYVLTQLFVFRFQFFHGTKNQKPENQKLPYDSSAVACFVGVSGVVIHNLIDYNLQFVGIALPFWMMMGMLAQKSQFSIFPFRARGPSGPNGNFPVQGLRPLRVEWQFSISRFQLPIHFMRAVEMSLATLLLVTAIWEGRYLLISSFGRHAEARGKGSEALAWYQAARGEVFSRDLHLSRTHLLLKENRLKEAKEAVETYIDRNSWDARGWKLLAQVALRRDDLLTARRATSEAWRLGKWNDAGILRLQLHVAIASGDQEFLDAQSMTIGALFRAFADAVLHNTHFIALSGNFEELIEVGKLLQQTYPERASSYTALMEEAGAHAREEREKWKARPMGRLW